MEKSSDSISYKHAESLQQYIHSTFQWPRQSLKMANMKAHTAASSLKKKISV